MKNDENILVIVKIELTFLTFQLPKNSSPSKFDVIWYRFHLLSLKKKNRSRFWKKKRKEILSFYWNPFFKKIVFFFISIIFMLYYANFSFIYLLLCEIFLYLYFVIQIFSFIDIFIMQNFSLWSTLKGEYAEVIVVTATISQQYSISVIAFTLTFKQSFKSYQFFFFGNLLWLEKKKIMIFNNDIFIAFNN